MGQILDGKHYAQKLKDKIKLEIEGMEPGCRPRLAIIQVADNPASTVYVQAKINQAAEVGIDAKLYHFSSSPSQADVEKTIDTLNQDPNTHGIIVQLPLPQDWDSQSILNQIHPDKDVDGLTETNVGRLSMGLNCLVPCTPLGCLILMQQLYKNLDGKNVVVVGRSNLVGKPLAQLFLKQNCTVTILHSKSVNPEKIASQADILIVAAGSLHLVHGNWVKPGAVVLDVGIHRLSTGKLAGDVDFESVLPIASYLTPVPGGIGPMTVACLLLNTTLAMAKQKKLSLKNLNGSPLCL
ncbi:MAG: bifunctional 5,10-methylenetetrahydrofolate dehydrogenase/5,10-methenyltetrahydrofolate cyclohydrolase [Alphaproteobacteria bacterium]|nr:bifunctional 5,10-methylenetetrahydrofolate dehydrogenase/5,10-methenyltetrahydrofolate cyclohydrolase [Alphaproteobacteria bacterium]